MALITCKNCGRQVLHHAKEMCTTCYKKLSWKPKLVKCKKCERMLPMHAKGFCRGCYNLVFHIKNIKNIRKYYNIKRNANIDPELYDKVTKSCIICGFDSVVELHHLDNVHINNSENNLIGLCPNHHRMLHHTNFREEVALILKEKGFNVPKGYLPDEEFK